MDPASIIALASAALTAFNKGMDALAAMKQDKEMTAEQEAEYDALIAERMKQPHWQRSDANNKPPETPSGLYPHHD